MDPLIAFQLGRIRQQEFIDEAARDHQGEATGLASRLSAIWQRLNVTLSNRFSPAAKAPECASQPNLITR